MFAWTTIYNNMLYSWSTAIAAQSPGRALSMAMTAQRLMSAQTDRWLYYGALDPEVRKKHYSRLNELLEEIVFRRIGEKESVQQPLYPFSREAAPYRSFPVLSGFFFTGFHVSLFVHGTQSVLQPER